MALNHKAEIFLKALQGAPAFQTMEPKVIREMMVKAVAKLEGPSLTKVEDQWLGVDATHQIKLRVYTPEGTGPFPLFVYYHGGGWVLGDVEGNIDHTCRIIANRTGTVVVSVNYRLAPEYPFPIPAEDSYQALLWVSEHAAFLQGDVSRIIVGGDSAGGNLATVVAMMARDRKGPSIYAQVLMYPVTQLEYNTDSYESFANGFGLDRDLMKWFGSLYVQNPSDQRQPYVAPLLADNLQGLPQALIITAENDVLRDEGMLYAEALQNSGVIVEYACKAGLIHGFFGNVVVFDEHVYEAVDHIDEFLKRINNYER